MRAKPIWSTVIGVLLTAIIAWGAWNTMATAVAVPTSLFNEHVQTSQEKQDHMQERIFDKLDEIKDTILDLHKGDK